MVYVATRNRIWNSDHSYSTIALIEGVGMKRLIILLLLSAVVTPAFAAATGLPFIADDYGSAMAKAKLRKLPIFVECWAPW